MQEILNFVGTSTIQVNSSVNSTYGPLVSLYQSAGSTSFCHNMTPAQAIEMGRALIDEACIMLRQPMPLTALEKGLKIGQALDTAVIESLKPDAYRYRYLRDLDDSISEDLFSELSGLNGADFDVAVDMAKNQVEA